MSGVTRNWSVEVIPKLSLLEKKRLHITRSLLELTEGKLALSCENNSYIDYKTPNANFAFAFNIETEVLSLTTYIESEERKLVTSPVFMTSHHDYSMS